MSTSSPSRLRRVLRSLWWFIDGSRRVLMNLLFLLLLVVLLFALLRGGGAPVLQDKTTLVLSLRGPIVEQRTGSTRDSLLAQAAGGGEANEVQLRDLLTALDAAAKDPKIGQALLLVDDFEGAGLATLREVAAALQRFKASGKPLVAWGSGYDQRSYFLAAQADELLMHPKGQVYIDGFGRYRTYYRDAFDKLGVTVNLLRVGNYKNAGEPFVENGPSPASVEAERYLLDGLWSLYTGEVEKARKFKPGAVQAMIDALPGSLVAVGGDPARLALDAKLVDALVTREELRQRLVKRGEPDTSDPKRPTFRQVSLGQYLATIKPDTGDAVGVIVAAGEISDGNEPGGKIGGLSTADLVRQARHDPAIKAVVLRVDSPGGSAFGSELIRQELALTRAAGKPVVVSMGDLAASGGYWISLAADEIIADPATITGSIGVFALLPRFDKAVDKLGLHTAGQPTTWLGGAADPLRPLDPRFGELVQAAVGHIYTDFTRLAAEARKSTPEKIDAVAQGRVWTGAQALERGLVDRVGSYQEALQAAAARAKLPATAPVRYIEREPGRLEQLTALLGGSLARLIADQVAADALLGAAPGALLRRAQDDLAWLRGVSDGREPYAAIVHCLCTAP